MTGFGGLDERPDIIEAEERRDVMAFMGECLDEAATRAGVLPAPVTNGRDLVADAARALRESTPAGARAAFAAAYAPPGVREHYQRVNAVQAAAMRALVLAARDQDPEAVRAVSDEAKRRGTLMGDLAGWESVADDLAAARWRP